MIRRRVQIVSPFRGASPSIQKRNIAYAEAAMGDSIDRGEAPFAPHLLYPRILDDNYDVERDIGIACGLAWLAAADAVVVYGDLGLSSGMRAEIAEARRLGIPVEERWLKDLVIDGRPVGADKD